MPLCMYIRVDHDWSHFDLLKKRKTKKKLQARNETPTTNPTDPKNASTDPNLAVDLVAVVHVVHLRALQLAEAEVFVVPDQAVVLAHVFLRVQPHLCHRKVSQRGENLFGAGFFFPQNNTGNGTGTEREVPKISKQFEQRGDGVALEKV